MDATEPQWRRSYLATLQEFEPGELARLIGATEDAMFVRLQELNVSSNGHVERQQIVDAGRALLKLKQDILKFPSIDFV
jgi:hypothetical protein